MIQTILAVGLLGFAVYTLIWAKPKKKDCGCGNCTCNITK